MIKKEIKVVLSEEAEKEFTELNKVVEAELKKGIKSSFNQALLRSINRVIDRLRQDPFAGE